MERYNDFMEGVCLLEDGAGNPADMSWAEDNPPLDETPTKEVTKKRKFCGAPNESGYHTYRSTASSTYASTIDEDEEDFLPVERENEMFTNEDFQKLITGKILGSPFKTIQDSCSPAKRARIFDQEGYDKKVKGALDKLDQQPDLIGDFTRIHALPTINGKHQDLKSISSSTVYELLKGEHSRTVDSFQIIDCRFPYEFDGGHIDGAFNYYMKEHIEDLLVKAANENKENTSNKHILVFHCEFSSERGPNLARFLRKLDRDYNMASYPKLTFPEIYLLDGGYSQYFKLYPKTCIPQQYLPMSHPDFLEELKHFRAKSKSENKTCKKKADGQRAHRQMRMNSSKF